MLVCLFFTVGNILFFIQNCLQTYSKTMEWLGSLRRVSMLLSFFHLFSGMMWGMGTLGGKHKNAFQQKWINIYIY